MATVDEVVVKVRADLKDINAKLSSLEKRVKTTTDKSSKAFQLFGRVAGVALAAVSGAAILRATGGIISLAASAEELQNKFNVVFGNQASLVKSQLQAFGNEARRSTQELMGMAASVQDLFVPLGFTREEAAKLSVQLTKLAVDVGSFNDMQDPEVMRAFASALVGNHETVRRFGVQIDQSTLQQELFRMGIDRNITSVDTQTKVLARLNLIINGTKDANNDAIETNDSFTNSSKALTASLEELSVAIGQKLLPILAPAQSAFADFINAINEGLQRRGVLDPQSTGMGIEVLAKQIQDAEKDLLDSQERIDGLFEMLGKVTDKSMREVIELNLQKAINDNQALIVEIMELKNKFEELLGTTEAFNKAFNKTKETTEKTIERTADQKEAYKELEKIINNLREQQKIYRDGIKLEDDALTQGNLAVLNYSELKKRLADSDKELIEVLRQEIVELNRVSEAYSEAQAKAEELKNKQEELKALNQIFIGVVDNLASAYEQNFIDALSGTKSALDSFKDFSRQVVEEILRTYLRLSIINPIINQIFGQSGLNFSGFTPRQEMSSSNVLSRFADIGKAAVGARAMGGSVTRGQPYMVGERGPEMFVPNSSGNIVPNNKLGGTVINQSLNFATGIQNTVRAEVMNMMPIIQNATLQAVVDQKRRGGAFAQGMG